MFFGRETGLGPVVPAESHKFANPQLILIFQLTSKQSRFWGVILKKIWLASLVVPFICRFVKYGFLRQLKVPQISNLGTIL